LTIILKLTIIGAIHKNYQEKPMEITTPTSLTTYDGRTAVESDRAWLAEVLADNTIHTPNDAIFDAPDGTEDSFKNSRIISTKDGTRILWVLTAFSKGAKTLAPLGIAVHPDHRGQGHYSRYVREVFQYSQANNVLDEYTNVHDQALPVAGNTGIPGTAATRTDRGYVIREGTVQDIYDSI
jgi:hypothetical protein